MPYLLLSSDQGETAERARPLPPTIRSMNTGLKLVCRQWIQFGWTRECGKDLDLLYTIYL
jgi:hypothetical protein